MTLLGKLPMKLQLLVLGGVFVVILVAMGGVGNLVAGRLGAELRLTHDILRQDKAVALAQHGIAVTRTRLDRYSPAQPLSMDEVRADLAETAKNLETAALSMTDAESGEAVKPDVARALQQQQETIGELGEVLALFDMQPTSTRREFLDSEVLPVIDGVAAVLAGIQDRIAGQVEAVDAASVGSLDRMRLVLGIGTVGLIALALGAAGWFGHALAKPVERAAQAVDRLTEKAYAVEVEGQDRGDEIGQIARSLETLRTRLARAQAQDDGAAHHSARRAALFDALGEAMGAMAEGRIDHRLQAADWSDLGDDSVKLCNDFNAFAERLADLLHSMRDSSETVHRNAHNLSTMSGEMARRAELRRPRWKKAPPHWKS